MPVALIVRLLQGLHFHEVRALRPTTAKRRSHKGRNRHGGVDIVAVLDTPLACVPVIVQVKQYQHPVARHFVDALRGAMLRRHAGQGLLITTSTFAPAARRAAAESSLLPITLLDGERLLDLLVHHQLGVRFLPHKTARPHQSRAPWKIDRAFFEPPSVRRSQVRQGSVPIAELESHAASALAQGADDRFNKPICLKGGGMQWRTHIALGLNTLWLLQPIPAAITPDTLLPLVAAVAFGSLLPDLDASESKIKYLSVGGVRPLVPLAILLHRSLGHRGLLHSFMGLGLCALPAATLSLWWGWQPAVGLLLGYAGHLAGDACTRTGIPLLYPRRRRYHLLPRPWRFTTGSAAEEVLFIALSMPLLGLLLLQLPFHLSSPST